MPFKKIYDAMTKGPLLMEAFEQAGEMHDLAKEEVELAFECLFGECDKDALRKLRLEDKRLNRMEVEIRKDIFEYLAVTSAPNINASLILVSTIIDYERIGDISKNIAQLGMIFPTELDEQEYISKIKEMKCKVIEIFDLTKGALIDEDEEKARKVFRLHDEIKDIHVALVKDLNTDNNLMVKNAISYALLSYYLRRINAHLANISSTTLNTFPHMGFKVKGK